jgi:hypothetical protein
MTHVCPTCNLPLDQSGTCPQCRQRLVTATAIVPHESLQSVSASAEIPYESGEAPISWDEVDRLLEKGEYAAAILVAAVNVEYTLKRLIGLIAKERTKVCKLTLGACIKRAKELLGKNTGWLKGDLDRQVVPLNCYRNKIAHERGYYAAFTQLKCVSEEQVRDVICKAREFCCLNQVSPFAALRGCDPGGRP